jgi:hypothetical protein
LEEGKEEGGREGQGGEGVLVEIVAAAAAAVAATAFAEHLAGKEPPSRGGWCGCHCSLLVRFLLSSQKVEEEGEEGREEGV